MLGERQTRALLAAADPARDLPVPRPELTAHDLIVRAEQQAGDSPRRAPRVARRLVLASVTALVAATAFGAVQGHQDRLAPRPAAGGTVVQPIAFTIPNHPPAAGDHLRDLADRAGEAPWDTMTGRYTFLHIQRWGDWGVGTPSGGYYKAAVSDGYTWTADDGSGRFVFKQLPPQYRDEASRAYFAKEPDLLDNSTDSDGEAYPWERPALPAGTAALTTALDVAEPTGVPDRLTKLYENYAIPRTVRADLLRILAGLPGYAWRGQVIDRAGRTGVAVTYRQPAGFQELLIFDPGTGALLAYETLQKDGFVSRYTLFLETGFTPTTR